MLLQCKTFNIFACKITYKRLLIGSTALVRHQLCCNELLKNIESKLLTELLVSIVLGDFYAA